MNYRSLENFDNARSRIRADRAVETALTSYVKEWGVRDMLCRVMAILEPEHPGVVTDIEAIAHKVNDGEYEA